MTDGLLDFLVKEKSFNEERVRSAVQRVINSKGKSTQGGEAWRGRNRVANLCKRLPYAFSTYILLRTTHHHPLNRPASGRLDSFFQPLGGSAKADSGSAKRKAGAKAGPEPKKGKLGAIGKKK